MGEVINLENVDIIDNKIYQFQEYTGRYILLEVGVSRTEICNNIKINEFKYNDTTCVIVSCIYNMNSLSSLNDICCIPLFKIIRKDNTTISYNFHTYEHKKNNMHISSLVSNHETKILLRGFFSYTIDNKIISKSSDFEGIKAIDKMIELIVIHED